MKVKSVTLVPILSKTVLGKGSHRLKVDGSSGDPKDAYLSFITNYLRLVDFEKMEDSTS